MTENTLYRPKLESGLNATLWSPCSVYTSSLIKQTANGILLEVDEKIEKASLSGDVSSLTARVGKLEITASSITSTVSSLSQSVSGNTERIGQLEVTDSQIKNTVSSLSQTVSGNTERIGQLEITDSQIKNTVSSLTETVNGNTEQIGQLTIKADSIEGRVEEIENNSAENKFPINGWMDKEENFINPSQLMLYSATKSFIRTPKLHLEAGTYCCSSYNSSGQQFSLSGDTETILPTITSSTTDTYQSCTRYYTVFSSITEGDYYFVYGNNDADSAFYRPKLEEGTQPTQYSEGTVKYDSVISQTAKEITLTVEQDINGELEQTGIDITNKKITAKADNFTIQNNSGETTFSVDENGNLNAAGGIAFSGNVNTENLFCRNGKAWVSIKSNEWNIPQVHINDGNGHYSTITPTEIVQHTSDTEEIRISGKDIYIEDGDNSIEIGWDSQFNTFNIFRRTATSNQRCVWEDVKG